MENLRSKPFWDRSPLESLADGYKKLPRNFKLCISKLITLHLIICSPCMNAPFSVSGAVGFVRSYSLIIPQAEIASQF